MDYKFFIAAWLKRLSLYRFDGIFSEFIGSIGKMAEAKYVSANFFKLLTNHKNKIKKSGSARGAGQLGVMEIRKWLPSVWLNISKNRFAFGLGEKRC